MGERSVGPAWALAATLLLSGCVGGGSGPAASPTATTTPRPSATASATAAPSGSADPNAPARQCADDVIEVTIEYLDAGAGSSYSQLIFANTGSVACELRGAPGVSVVDDAGVQLGEAAQQEAAETPDTVTLEPGDSVPAQLRAVNIDPDGGPLVDCPVVYGTAYLVYPPHSFTPVEVTTAVPACDSSTPFLAVGPVGRG